MLYRKRIAGGAYGKSIYTEEREKLKGEVVELVRRSGRETLRQLENKTGATRYLMSVLARELVASGDVYNSVTGYSHLNGSCGLAKRPQKLSRAKLKKPVVVDLTLSGHYQTGKYAAMTGVNWRHNL